MSKTIKKVDLSVPAKLYGFEKDKVQENFSRAKLDVFYVGTTADGRKFPKSFSKKLAKTLPYTPIVSFYDKEKEDFVGHASEQQILGIVDPRTETTFKVDEDGTEWCTCDVVLYTERPDQVGELAKKVVGHAQSLELDPRSVKYKINYDERKHIKDIEFIEGTFVGLSVLGNDQTPAFSGSSFFEINNFEEKMNLLRNYCENNGQNLEGDKNKMELLDFMKLSWGDISEKVYRSMCEEFAEDGFVSPVDMFDNYGIFNIFYYDGNKKLLKAIYSVDEEGKISVDAIKEVKVQYVEIEDESNYSAKGPEAEGEKTTTTTMTVDEEPIVEPVTDPVVEPIVEPVVEPIVEPTNNPIQEPSPEDDKTFEETKVNMPEDVKSPEEQEERENQVDEQEPKADKDSGSTSFTESEREELESLRKEKKLNLLNQYKEYLTEEEFKNFDEQINTFSFEDLEKELLKKYKIFTENHSKEEKDKEPAEASFNRIFYGMPAVNKKSGLDATIKKYLDY